MAHSESAKPNCSEPVLDRRWSQILFAGSVAGLLDILFVTTMWNLLGVRPTTVLQSIASGLLGKISFQGGSSTALLGLVLHFIMTICMAWTFAALAPNALRHKPLLGGSLYGIGIWSVMNFIVVPLSAAPISIPPVLIAIADIASHVFLVGIPIAYFTRKLRRDAV